MYIILAAVLYLPVGLYCCRFQHEFYRALEEDEDEDDDDDDEPDSASEPKLYRLVRAGQPVVL